MNLPSLFVLRGFFIYLQTNKGMVTIKLEMWQAIALKAIMQSVCNERREALQRTLSMREFYSKEELPNEKLNEWITASHARMEEAVELYKLFCIVSERR